MDALFRRLALALAFVIALGPAADAFYPFGNLNAGRVRSTGASCSDTTLHTITATGASSLTVPSGCRHVTGWVFGGGGSGSTETGGAGACAAGTANLVVTPGATVYYSVGAGGAATSVAPGNPGAQSWFNISGNSAPGSSAAGALAYFGAGGGSSTSAVTGCLTSASIGGTLWAGGASANGAFGGAGGGGAGSGGAGNAGNTITAGSGGSASSPFAAGGAGGGGGSCSPLAGAQPGGGGCGGQAPAGKGGDGEFQYEFSAFLDTPSANDNFATLQEAA